jgi:hypothetical protein
VYDKGRRRNSKLQKGNGSKAVGRYRVGKVREAGTILRIAGICSGRKGRERVEP